jgi:hypothetical protein
MKFAEDVFNRYERLYNKAKRTQAAEEVKVKNITLKALNGDFTGGVKPISEEELRNISPDLKVTLARWEERDIKGYQDTIDNVLTENARGDTNKNSANFYRVLIETMRSEKPTEESIHGLLARKDGTGINMKDYNDLSRVLNDMQNNKTWIDDFVLPAMEEVLKSGGNVDGMGESRALQFFTLLERGRRVKQKEGLSLDEMMQEPGWFAKKEEYLSEMVEAFKPTRERQIEYMANNTIIPAVLKRGDIVLGYEYIGGDVISDSSWKKARQ